MNEVKVMSVSHINDFRDKNLLWFLDNKWDNAADYLTDKYESKNVNKHFIWNLYKSLVIIFNRNYF